jgi:flagella basal body P-ring formation protein FlgA
MAHPTIADTRSLPVPAATIYPGERISEQTLVEKLFTATSSGFNGFATDARQVRDKYARRTLVAGLPISLSSVREREAVRRGRPAPAFLRSDGLTITLMLLPLESATADQIIEARNPESGATVRARVQDDGSLAIGGE